MRRLARGAADDNKVGDAAAEEVSFAASAAGATENAEDKQDDDDDDDDDDDATTVTVSVATGAQDAGGPEYNTSAPFCSNRACGDITQSLKH